MEVKKNAKQAKILALLERHRYRYAHNKIPLETSMFL